MLRKPRSSFADIVSAECLKNGFVLTYVNKQPVLVPVAKKKPAKANNDLEVLKSLRYLP